MVGRSEGDIQNLLEAAERSNRELKALLDANESLASSLDLDHILRTIVRGAAEISGASAVRLFLLDEENRVLRCRVGIGLPPEGERELEVPGGESFSGQVANTGEVLAISDVRGDDRLRYPQHVTEFGLISYLGLPVKAGDRILGVLVFNTGAPRDYAEREVAFLSSFARQAAVSIENARIHEAAVRRSQQLASLNAVTARLTSELDPQKVARAILEAVQLLVPDSAGRLWDWREGDEALRLVASIGLRNPEGGRAVRFRMGEGLAGIAAAARQPMVSRDITSDPRFVNREWALEEGLASCIIIPLLYRHQIHGILAIFTRTPHQFSEEEVALFQSFASQAAIAIENARLYEQVHAQAAGLEASVKERTAELEDALRVKAQFLATMSHELRTPLNHILGFAQLLQAQGTAGTLTAKQAQYVARIHAGGKRLVELINEILDLSMIETGVSSLQVEAIPLAPLIQEVLVQVAVQTAQKRIEITTALDPAAPFAFADRRRLVQILSHLLGNAVKFTPQGGTVRVTAHRVNWSSSQFVESSQPVDQLTTQPVDSLEIRVTDSGIGIQTEDLDRIFRGFVQADASVGRRHGGAGIGLTLVRTLVEQHGGRVWAESAGPGCGACFAVQLPLKKPLRPKRILVVEDEAAVLDTLGAALERAGYAVDRAQNGTQALASLSADLPDLLVLDIGLPDVTGWEILKRVRGESRTQDLPILVLTGLGDVQAWQAHALGANEFLAKPVSMGVFVEAVRAVLARPSAPRVEGGGATG